MTRNVFQWVLKSVLIGIGLLLIGCTSERVPLPVNEPMRAELFTCPPVPLYAYAVQRARLPDEPYGSKVTRYTTMQTMAEVYAWYRSTLPEQWKEMPPKDPGVLFAYEYRGLTIFPDTTLALQEEVNAEEGMTGFVIKLRFHHPHDSRDWCPRLAP
jgi:hypothetical protein